MVNRMHKRSRVVCAGMMIMLLVLVLLPLSDWMELGVQAGRKAEDVYEPLLNIHNQIQAEKAQDGISVGGVIELEEAWEIEDTREESFEPLVTAMLNGSDVLGFDAAENTFYCTIGLENEDEWPEISLKARNVSDGLEIRLIDDYTYDWCSDAVREGYRYEMLAYTDTQYNYFGIVFTGLPIVSIAVDDHESLGDEYVPARAAISSADHEAVDHTAMIHLRGGGFDIYKVDKKSYRLEFHEIDNAGKDHKKSLGVLGMEEDTDWLLIGNGSDTTCVRNQLAWILWNRWNPKKDVHGLLDSKLVEVFVNNEYRGMYQLMKRYDIEKEIERRGGYLWKDMVFRAITSHNIDSQRPAYRSSRGTIELRYKPEHVSVKQAFELIEQYAKMQESISDEEFERLVETYVDIEALMSYYLFHLAADLSGDNVNNNLYIWAEHNEKGEVAFRFSPWDMDLAFTMRDWEEAQKEQAFLYMPIPRRVLDLNLENSREMIWKIWNEKRSTILTDDAIYNWFMDMEEYVNRSGAALRDSQEWYGNAQPLDLAQMMSNETTHMSMIEHYLLALWPLEGMVQ